MNESEHGNRIVFRSRFGIVLTVVVWVICAGGVISAIVSGAGILPVVLLSTLGWFVWLAFWRPCVVTDAAGVELHNLVRDVSIPYGAIENVDTRFALVVTADGRNYSAWGAPAPGGGSAMRDSMSRRRSGQTDWRDAPRSVRDAGSARAGDAVTSASGAPATVIRRELDRRDREGIPRSVDARVRVNVRAPLVAVSTLALVASVAVILIG